MIKENHFRLPELLSLDKKINLLPIKHTKYVPDVICFDYCQAILLGLQQILCVSSAWRDFQVTNIAGKSSSLTEP